MKTLAVHDGNFHADDVFSAAILKLIYPDLKVIRTSDPEKLKQADIRADVGRKYDHATRDYDHHQVGFNEHRTDGTTHAAVGLIWRHYGKELTNTPEAFEYIDKKLIRPIDLNDNGIKNYDSEEVYTLQDILQLYKPHWETPELNYDKYFAEAVELATKILTEELKLVNSLKKVKEIVQQAIETGEDGYIVLENPKTPWRDINLKESIKFVITPYEDYWSIKTVPKEHGSFESRQPLPAEWAGLTREELVKVTGVEGAWDIHKARFVGFAKTKQAAIELVKKALI